MDEQHQEQFTHVAMAARPHRHLASFAASIAAHAAIVVLIVCFVSPLARTPGEWVLAYLVEGTDGAASGRGGARAGASAPVATAPAPKRADSAPRAAVPPAPPPRALRHRRRQPIDDADAEVVALKRPVALARPSASGREESAASHGDAASAHAAAVGSDSGADRGGAGSPGAAEGGAGADPSSSAHADYARNPPPIYPALARRREQQGTVTVRVLVGADGSVERAEVADSSGFDALDAAALETVRWRWRFVPARRAGVAVESWVLVPIRFALVEANAIR